MREIWATYRWFFGLIGLSALVAVVGNELSGHQEHKLELAEAYDRGFDDGKAAQAAEAQSMAQRVASAPAPDGRYNEPVRQWTPARRQGAAAQLERPSLAGAAAPTTEWDRLQRQLGVEKPGARQ